MDQVNIGYLNPMNIRLSNKELKIVPLDDTCFHLIRKTPHNYNSLIKDLKYFSLRRVRYVG